MILDKLNEFADATALNTGAAGGYLIGNQIDLGLNGRDVGGIEPGVPAVSGICALFPASGQVQENR